MCYVLLTNRIQQSCLQHDIVSPQKKNKNSWLHEMLSELFYGGPEVCDWLNVYRLSLVQNVLLSIGILQMLL